MKKFYALAVIPVCILSFVSCFGTSAQTTNTPLTNTPPTPTTPTTNTPSAYNTLWIPPLLEGTTTAAGTSYNLTLAKSTKKMLIGTATPTYGYNGSDFWGPTVILKKGQNVTLNVTNKLSEDTTTHWHGLHLPAEMDGGPMQVIAPNATWSPKFTVMNTASTYWYHPHMHTKTMEQMALGAGGLIIVQDDAESALALPRTYGVDDIPLVLTSRTFKADNQISTTTIYGDNLLTNGILNAQTTLPAQVVRLRLLNTETERAYNLGFADGRTFQVIGSDGGLLNAPAPVTRVVMLPGERYEILVNLSSDAVGSSLELKSYNGGQEFGFPGGEPADSGAFGSKLNNKTFQVLHINVGKATANAITSIPSKLLDNTYLTEAEATNSRTIAITDKGPGTPFTFNNMGYMMDMINQTITLGTVEKWSIVNGPTFGHSFHIHDVQFKITSRSSGPISAAESGWKDTFYIHRNETVRFVAKFSDFASNTNAFMYHCHMANHEDEGLMGQFLVVAK